MPSHRQVANSMDGWKHKTGEVPTFAGCVSLSAPLSEMPVALSVEEMMTCCPCSSALQSHWVRPTGISGVQSHSCASVDIAVRSLHLSGILSMFGTISFFTTVHGMYPGEQ